MATAILISSPKFPADIKIEPNVSSSKVTGHKEVNPFIGQSVN